MDYIKNIVKIRKQRKESQSQIANLLEIPQQQYSRYESGKNEMPIRYLIKLCLHWGISTDLALGMPIPENLVDTLKSLKDDETDNKNDKG